MEISLYYVSGIWLECSLAFDVLWSDFSSDTLGVVPPPNGATQPRTGEETTVPTANKNYIIRTRLTRFNTGYIAGVGPLQYKQERPPITHNIVQERE